MRRAWPGALGALGGALVAAALALAWRDGASELALQRLRIALALLALVLVGAEARRRAPVRREVVQGVAGALTVLGLVSYFALQWPLEQRALKTHDLFHYYLGARYQRELSYTHLYECAALAEAEDGGEAQVRARTTRRLSDDRLVSGAEVLAAAPSACRPRFRDERWRSFVEDARTLRARFSPAEWDAVMQDHGYNPPPTWALAGALFASLHAPTPGFLLGLTCLDLACLAGMMAAAWWGFGLRALALMMVFLGSQEPANVGWLGGSFLRQDWMLLVVLGLAALARRRHAAAGAALVAATMLRVIPVFLLLGPVLVLGARCWRQRRWTRGARRFAAGGLVAGALLLSASVAAFGPRAWLEFASHLRVHSAQVSLNRVGLSELLQHDVSGRHHGATSDAGPGQWDAWRARRLAQARSLWPLRAAGVVGALAVVVAARRRPAWVAAILGLPLLAAALSLSCYYWVVLIVVALLGRVAPPLERTVLGALLAGAVLVTMPAFSLDMDHRFATQSLVFVGMLGAVSWRLWPRRAAAAPAGGQGALSRP